MFNVIYIYIEINVIQCNVIRCIHYVIDIFFLNSSVTQR